MGEMMTLQLGHYANHVAAHLFNLQDLQLEYGTAPDMVAAAAESGRVLPDALFRAGETLHGTPTYTPRTLLFDLHTALGAVPKEGSLYSGENGGQRPAGSLLWESERTVTMAEKASSPSAYLSALESHGEAHAAAAWTEPTSWSDYLRPHLHPRSANVVKSYRHNDPDVPFEGYWHGLDAWDQDRGMQANFEDRLRAYMEEADACQGFQVFTHMHDGFAGLTQRVLEHVRDEYGTKTVATFGMVPPGALPPPAPHNSHNLTPEELKTQRRQRDAENIASLTYGLAAANLGELSTTLVPLSVCPSWRRRQEGRQLPAFRYKLRDTYSTSALLALAIDVATLPARQRDSTVLLGQLGGALSHPSGLSELQLTSLAPGTSLSDAAHTWAQTAKTGGGSVLPLGLTPDAAGVSDGMGFAALSLRGTAELSLVPTDAELQARRTVRPWDRSRNADELLQSVLGEGRHAALFHVATHAPPLPWPVPPLPAVLRDAQQGVVSAAAVWASGPRLASTAHAMRDALVSVDARPHLSALVDAEMVAAAREDLESRCSAF